jgi:hypothetical protein
MDQETIDSSVLSRPVVTGFDVQREFLVYSYLSLIERLCRIDAVIERAQIDAPSAASPVFEKLHGMVNFQWKEMIKYGIGRKMSNLQPRDTKTVYSLLQTQHATLPDLHDAAVRWISGPWTDPQIASAILLSIRTSAGLRTHNSLVALSPIVAQVGVYDFLGDLRPRESPKLPGELVGESNALVIWATPAAEVPNPLSWAMLFHEVAHTLIAKTPGLDDGLRKKMGTVNPADAALLIAFLTELLADRIAVDVAGPAYFAALTTFGILQGQQSLRERKADRRNGHAYPCIMERVSLLKHHIQFGLDIPFTLRNAPDMSMASKIERLFQGRCEVDEATFKAIFHPEYKESWLPEDATWLELLDWAYGIVSQTNWEGPRYNQSLHVGAVELSEHLMSRRPVAASQDPSAVAAACEILSRKTLAECTPDERAIVVAGPRETPNPPISILNAAWIAELAIWQEEQARCLLKDFENEDLLASAVQETRDLIALKDSLVGKSIEAGLLHREMMPIATHTLQEDGHNELAPT